LSGEITMLKKIKEFIAKETVLCVAAGCAIATMFIIPPDREYLHYIDFRVLCLLLCLMAVVAGLKAIGLFNWLTFQLLHRIQNGRILSVTLVLLPFFSSMFVTNDVALIIFIPFTLMLLQQLDCSRNIIPITVFQTIAANLGSMATPIGNPQNLYLYAFYNLSIRDFFSVTLPLTIVSLIGLSICAIPLLPKKLPSQALEKATIRTFKHLVIYLALFTLCLLTVFRVIPYTVTTAITVIVLFIVDRKLLKEIDYMLLLTFVCFFAVSENLGRMDSIRVFLQNLLQSSTLLTAVGASQVISNVPAAVVLSGFTDQWQQMLAGVNIGGLGTPIASLASLITLKLYMRWPNANVMRFLGVFTVANIIGLIILLMFTMVL
jgi:Na+/H+ antiporter NhaD/arsenite permease-like protein